MTEMTENSRSLDAAGSGVYTADQVQAIADAAATNAIATLFGGFGGAVPAHLDNSTGSTELSSKGDDSMARIRQRVTLPDGSTTWCTGDTIGAAINNIVTRIAKQVAKETQPQLPPAPTLRDYGDQWYKHYHCKKVKYNTAYNTLTLLKLHVYPYLGDKPLNKIDFDDIQGLFDHLADHSRSTNEKVRIILNQIYKNAIEDGLITTNPMASSRYVLSRTKTKRTSLKTAELRDIINHLDDLQGNDRMLLALAIYTGMRRGEILALNWDDVDIVHACIHVVHSVTFSHNRAKITPPKSAAGIRDIPIIADLMRVFDVIPDTDRVGYLIKSPSCPGEPISECTYVRMWERIKKHINLHGATLHVFRHTYATIMAPRMDAKVLQQIMGHGDIRMTLDVYADMQDDRFAIIKKIDGFVTSPCDTQVTQKSSLSGSTQGFAGGML